MRRYAAILPELEAQGIRYAPAVFTAYGREHGDVGRMLAAAAVKMDRVGGEAKGKDRLKCWRRALVAGQTSLARATENKNLRIVYSTSAVQFLHLRISVPVQAHVNSELDQSSGADGMNTVPFGSSPRGTVPRNGVLERSSERVSTCIDIACNI
jgi:hypothetical protein